MTKHTRISAKGQVVIPKDVRDRLHWEPGTELEVVDGPSGVMLRAKLHKKGQYSFEESIARLQATANYKGPKITDQDAKAAIDEMFRRDPKWDSKGQ
jgi:AbrB family looped-hinge helix DNA binding protein